MSRLTPGRAGGLLLLVAVAVPPSWVERGPPLCLLKAITGLPCPGCGLIRSLVALGHGDLGAALYLHPLGPFVGLVLLVLAMAELVQRSDDEASASSSGTGDTAATALLHRAANGPLAWVTVAAFLMVWVVRLPLYLAGQWVY